MEAEADLHAVAGGDLLVAGGCRAEAGGCWTAGSGVSPSVEMRRHGLTGVAEAGAYRLE